MGSTNRNKKIKDLISIKSVDNQLNTSLRLLINISQYFSIKVFLIETSRKIKIYLLNNKIIL